MKTKLEKVQNLIKLNDYCSDDPTDAGPILELIEDCLDDKLESGRFVKFPYTIIASSNSSNSTNCYNLTVRLDGSGNFDNRCFVIESPWAFKYRPVEVDPNGWFIWAEILYEFEPQPRQNADLKDEYNDIPTLFRFHGPKLNFANSDVLFIHNLAAAIDEGLSYKKWGLNAFPKNRNGYKKTNHTPPLFFDKEGKITNKLGEDSQWLKVHNYD